MVDLLYEEGYLDASSHRIDGQVDEKAEYLGHGGDEEGEY